MYLKKKTETKEYSSHYTEKLLGLINDCNSTVTITIGNEYETTINGKLKKVNIDEEHGGGVTLSQSYQNNTTKEIFYDIKIIISGNSNNKLLDQTDKPLEDKAEDILSHEIVGHAAPKILGSDTGNAVENENKVRKELNKPLRKEDPNHVE